MLKIFSKPLGIGKQTESIKMKKVKNLIVGCGLSGIVLAERIASELKEEVLIIDKRDHIGGNVFDYKDKDTGITVHQYGPHVFHTNDKNVWDYLSRFTDWHRFMYRVKAVMDGIEVNIPFNLDSLHKVFPRQMAEKLETKLIEKFGFNKKVPILELRKANDADLEFLAQYVYEKVFLGYTVKQWSVKPEDLDASVSGRVPVYISRDSRYFQDKYQGIPLNGYTKMVENILNHPNIEVRLNTDFKDITEKFDKIFYSGAIDEYFDYKYGELPYRSLEFDVQVINKEYYQKSAMTNYPNNYDFTRITEHKHFLDEKSDKTVISIEYPQQFELGKNERYYPISNPQNQALYDKYKEEAKKISGLYFIGRLGEYKYYNMDLAVENIFKIFGELK